MKEWMVVGLVFLAFGLTARIGNCWEADTHYGLTKWLAVKAGFSLEDAEIIAAGAESPDESTVLNAGFVVPTCVCIGRSAEASRHVQQHHFPSDGFVPSPRQERRVVPGEPSIQNAGNRWVRQEIALPQGQGPRNTYLNRFGQSLHSLGDSWTHQGVPDMIPLICTEELVWSHSEERGGYMSHDADLTHKNVKDAVETAKAVYHYLGQFLKRNRQFLRGSKTPRPWAELEERVVRFAKARTALEKKEWFDANADVPLESYTTYPCFLRTTSLKDHNKICPSKPGEKEKRESGIQDVVPPGKELDRGAREFFEYFLTTWIVRGEVNELVSRSIEISSVRRGLTGRRFEQVPVREDAWFRTLLLMWLVPDHGLINESGHGLPWKRGFETLAPERIQNMLLKFDSIADAIHFPGSSLPFLPIAVDEKAFGPESYGALFQFRHTPRDMIALIARRIGGEWKVVGLVWVAL